MWKPVVLRVTAFGLEALSPQSGMDCIQTRTMLPLLQFDVWLSGVLNAASTNNGSSSGGSSGSGGQLADASNKGHTMWVSCMHVAVCCPCL